MVRPLEENKEGCGRTLGGEVAVTGYQLPVAKVNWLQAIAIGTLLFGA
jgi:hypothetical protein